MLASQTQETTLALMMRVLGMILENPATDDGARLALLSLVGFTIL